MEHGELRPVKLPLYMLASPFVVFWSKGTPIACGLLAHQISILTAKRSKDYAHFGLHPQPLSA